MSSHSATVNGADEKCWRVQIRLDAPTLKIAAVQWAIFSDDPVAKFRTDMARTGSLFRNRPGEKGDAPVLRATWSQAAVIWDHLFASIPGNRVYMVTTTPPLLTVSGEASTAGKRWLVTKTVRKDSGAYCWCIPFEAAVGHKESILLSESNILTVAGLAESGDDAAPSGA